MDPSATPPSRARVTRRSVHITDRIATAVITAGGLGVVVAVLGICVYLFAVTARLFVPGEAAPVAAARVDAPSRPLFVQLDEHRSSALFLDEAGILRVFEITTGKVVHERKIVPEGRTITALCRAPRGGHIALGFDDGSLKIGRIGYDVEFLFDDLAERDNADLQPGQARPYRDGVVTRTTLGQLRLARPLVELPEEAVPLDAGDGPVMALSYDVGADAEYVVVLRREGDLIFNQVDKIVPLGGGEPRIDLTTSTIPYAPPPGLPRTPGWLFVTGDGAHTYLLWPDGTAQRYATGSPGQAVLADTVQLLEPGRTLLSARLLLGGLTLVLGDDAGNVYGAFAARDPAADTPDRMRLVRAHDLGSVGAPVADIAVTERDRSFVVADADGWLTIRNMTSHKRVARFRADHLDSVARVAVAPKFDGVLAIAPDGKYQLWSLDPAHPEATPSSLFGAVWYEGDPGPGFVYQSSSADDAAEPKLSLVPLIFGTFKATLYTMILAVPVAVLAAIFTSEFLDRRVRAVIKPTIETMASLPSVVLGFIAAMVLAPWLVRFLPGVLLALAAVPLAVLLAAHLWHFIPTRHAARAPNWLRALLILAVTIVSAAAALRLGPLMEAALFTPRGGDLLVMAGSVEPVPPEQRPAWLGARHSVTPRQARLLRAEGLYVQAGQLVRPTGATSDPAVAETIRLYNLDAPNLRGWLNSTFGGPWPGWFLITFPAGVILAALAAARFLDPWLRTLNVAQDRRTAPLVELVKFLAVVALGTLLAAAIAAALSSAGLDPRDSIVGTFQQRNTLVVALALAVAVIPIIYTICEDAMASVPDHLRSASLAAGATRWQTAVRVVLPVAMSGVFSATMIGLGRAAGETMIVLMATGNTPIMSMSLFDGMRTLSANIAVELPEAPRDSTHYRVLFLCGLVLFVITFLINTVAEVVRQRYRRRSAEL